MSTQTITIIGMALLLLASAWRIRRILFKHIPENHGSVQGHGRLHINSVFSLEHLEAFINTQKN